MADRGFKHIDSLLATKNCKLIRPPSIASGSKSTKEDVKLSKRIVSLRIHIERVIRRLREFEMLKPHACIDLTMAWKLDCSFYCMWHHKFSGLFNKVKCTSYFTRSCRKQTDVGFYKCMALFCNHAEIDPSYVICLTVIYKITKFSRKTILFYFFILLRLCILNIFE